MKNVRRMLLPAAVAIWAVGVAAGFRAFHAYGNAPGTAGPAPALAPDETRAEADDRRPRLIAFAHPRCPCTGATLAELAALLDLDRSGVAAEVRFVRPAGVPEGWERTPLWRTASAIPGVAVSCDDGGVLARRFGAEHRATSSSPTPTAGSCSPAASPARGGTGDNPGRRAVLALLAGVPAPPRTPVFGCPLFAPDECRGKESDPCRP